MYIAMNRFKIVRGMEDDFIEIWKKRESHLDGVPGFREFHLLQGQSFDDYTLFASHSVWDSAQVFEDWTRSEAFRRAHAHAGSTKSVYMGPPNLELFEAVL